MLNVLQKKIWIPKNSKEKLEELGRKKFTLPEKYREQIAHNLGTTSLQPCGKLQVSTLFFSFPEQKRFYKVTDSLLIRHRFK